VCCLAKVDALYTTVAAFGEYIRDTSLPIQKEIKRQGSCGSLRSAPSNDTSLLLDTSRDFVSGAFSRMTRSRADIDPSAARVYQDVLLSLSLEDVQQFAALKTPLFKGYRLRYFIGMEHIKTNSNDRLTVSYSQNEIASDITSGYSYTSKPNPDVPPPAAGEPGQPRQAPEPLIRDISIRLRDIQHRPHNKKTSKFAAVQIIVPAGFTSNDRQNFIPHSSLRASVGYTKYDATPTAVYPCLETYGGAQKDKVDTLLQEQAWCLTEEPMCQAKDPAVVAGGGIIDVSFPLEEGVWDQDLATSDQFFYKSLFLSFMLILKDANGYVQIASVQTQTEIRSDDVQYLCRQETVVANVHDILSVDVFLGLVGDETQCNQSLVQNFDITRKAAGMPYISREISSKESNVLSIVVKGDDRLFSQDFAKDYSLVVEDMITIHFLDTDKKTLVQSMIDAGTAFTTERGDASRSESLMRMFPSQALLGICPIMATAGQFGCVTRKEITARKLEFERGGIVNFAHYEQGVAAASARNVSSASSPHSPSDLALAGQHFLPGLWTQTVLGPSEYARELGRNHSSILNKKFALNSRYRNAYMLSPTVEWGQDGLDQQNVNSILDLAQFSITTMMFSLDTNIGFTYTPRIQMLIPSMLDISFEELAAMQDTLVAAYAYATNLPTADIHFDLSVTPEQRRRRLLSVTPDAPPQRPRRSQVGQPESTGSIFFNTVLRFRAADTITARANARKIKQALQTPDSIISPVLTHGIALAIKASSPPSLAEAAFLKHAHARVVDSDTLIDEPTDLVECRDKVSWQMDVAPVLGLDIPYAFVGCDERATNVSRIKMGICGPVQREHWNTQVQSTVLSVHTPQDGWQWWDFCANPPLLLLGNDDVYCNSYRMS